MAEGATSFLPRAEELKPEADRFEDWPHPREMLQLYGHDAAQGEFIDAFQNGNMHHAWILSGLEGIGKSTLAYRIARFVLASDESREALGPQDLMSDPKLATNRQIANMAHPGLMTIRRVWNEKTKKLSTIIPVDEVRRLKSFLQHTSTTSGAWRMVIVDRADDLNVNAANALLKSLEEPPKNCLFLLISSEPGRLLPTIRSRCRTLELSPLPPLELRTAVGSVLERAPGKADERLFDLADGCVRRYLALSAGDGLKYYEQLLGLLASLPNLDQGRLLKLSDELSLVTAQQSFEIFFDLFFSTLARNIRGQAGGEGLFEHEKSTLGHMISTSSLAQWASLWETIAAEKADVARLNLDKKSFVLETFYRMQTLTRRAAG